MWKRNRKKGEEEHEKIRRKKEAQGERAAGGRGHGRPQPRQLQCLAPRVTARGFCSPLVWLVSLGPASSSSFYLSFLPSCIPTSPSFPSPPGMDLAPSSSGTTAVLKESRRSPRACSLAYFCGQPAVWKLRATAWTVAYHQAPLPVLGISPGKDTRVDCQALPENIPNPGMEPMSLSPALAGSFFTTSAPSEAPAYLAGPALTFGFAPSNAEFDLLSRLVPVSSSLPTPSYLALPSMHHHCLAVGLRALTLPP